MTPTRISRRRLLLCLVTGLLACLAGGSAPARDKEAPTLNLWPGTPPGDPATAPAAERDLTTDKDGLVAGRRLIRLGNVYQPTLTFHPAPKRKATGTTVLVCPGGGYHILAMDLEGTEICDWLNSIGVHAALLKYRVPVRKDRERHAAPLQDVQRAMGLLRQHAAEWGVDPSRIGVLGFSAGGHLAALASNQYQSRSYPAVDAADQLSTRPDFSVLIYPAYLTVEKEGDRIAPELPITGTTPPTFIVLAEDDPVRVENGLFYYAALKKAKVPAEMHLYATGGHGYGLRATQEPITRWPVLVADWMRHQGLLTPHEKSK